MLSQRVARAAGLHRGFAAVARTAPPVRVQPWAAAQRRGFTPYAYDKKVVDEMFPDPPTLTEAEDPDMVSPVLRTSLCFLAFSRRRPEKAG